MKYMEPYMHRLNTYGNTRGRSRKGERRGEEGRGKGRRGGSVLWLLKTRPVTEAIHQGWFIP